MKEIFMPNAEIARTELRPEDLGAMKNTLKILTPDRKRYRPKRLLSITGLGQTELSRTLGTPRPRLYENELPLRLSSKVTKAIMSLVIATDLASELFEGSEEHTKNWLMAPNTLLFGDSPFIVCMRG